MKLSKLQIKLNLSNKAVRAILDEWGFEGYNTLEDVLEDREYLEELGYSIDAFIKEFGLED